MTAAALSVIVTNARIRTGNSSRPWATALGISDGKLAVVGSAAEILKMAARDTTIMDANGALLSLPEGAVVGSAVTVLRSADSVVTLSPGRE